MVTNMINLVRLLIHRLGQAIALAGVNVRKSVQLECERAMAQTAQVHSECLCVQFVRNLREIRQHWRSFLVRVLISTLIVTILFWLLSNYGQHSDLLRQADDWSQDVVMALNNNRDPPKNPTLPMKLIYEIDDAAFRDWGTPVLLPRDKLLSLLRRAERAGASVILVDIDLTRPSGGLSATQGRLSEADRALAEYLKQLNDSDDPERPLVILPRSLRKPLHEGVVDEGALFEPVPSFLDPFLIEQKRVFWGSMQFAVDEDGVIRRWRLAEAYCREGNLGILPSVQLLAARAALAAGSNADKAMAVRDLYRQVQGQGGQTPTCKMIRGGPDLATLMERYPVFQDKRHNNLSLSGTQAGPWISHDALGRTSRIIYRLYPGPEARKRQIEVVPANEALARQENELDALGRTVLIGASFAESLDLHRRPFYDQLIPGVVIIANAIDTLEQYGELRPIQLSLLLAMVILMANLLWSVLVEILPLPAEIAIWLALLPLGLYFGLIFVDKGWGTFSVGLLLLISQFLHSGFVKRSGIRVIGGLCRCCQTV